jgi:hypothetical protein
MPKPDTSRPTSEPPRRPGDTCELRTRGLAQTERPSVVIATATDGGRPVCTENPIRVDDVTESPKLAE